MQITVSERRGVPHHLLDILPADAQFSAGHFHDLARAAIQDILQVSLSHILPCQQSYVKETDCCCHLCAQIALQQLDSKLVMT